MSLQITDSFLTRKKVTEGAIEWRADPSCPGLRVRVSESRTRGRSVSWYYRYRKPDGKLQPIQIGEYPAVSLEEARQLVTHELRPLARAGRDVKREYHRRMERSAKEAETGDGQTIYALIPKYLSSCKSAGLAERTIAAYRFALRPVAHAWGNRDPKEITRGDAQDLFYTVQAEGVPPYDIDGSPIEKPSQRIQRGGDRAAGSTHSVARAFWTYLLDRELVDANPWARQKKLASKGRAAVGDRALDDKEIAVVLTTEILSLRDQTLLKVMLGTGLRPGECCATRWSEIDLETGIWTLPKGRLKFKGAGHTVYLSGYVLKALKAWRKTQRGQPRYVFPALRDTHIKVDNLTERFKKIGVAGFTPKVTRSTFRTGLQRLGCPKEVREKMTHHQERDQVAKSYDHYDFAQECQHWWQQWGIHLTRLEKGQAGLAVATKLRVVA